MARAPNVGALQLDLASLLDKLVAVRMDLEPICGTSEVRAQVVDSPAAIAEACDILRSAITDLLSVMSQLEGLTGGTDGSPRSRNGDRPHHATEG